MWTSSMENRKAPITKHFFYCCCCCCRYKKQCTILKSQDTNTLDLIINVFILYIYKDVVHDVQTPSKVTAMRREKKQHTQIPRMPKACEKPMSSCIQWFSFQLKLSWCIILVIGFSVCVIVCYYQTVKRSFAEVVLHFVVMMVTPLMSCTAF